jgi:hypothetical protein
MLDVKGCHKARAEVTQSLHLSKRVARLQAEGADTKFFLVPNL